MKKLKLTIIGGGTIAEAMLGRVLAAAILPKEDIVVSDIKANRCQYLSDTYGIQTTTNNEVAIRHADIVLLAVKPQVCAKVLEQLSNYLKDKSLISIVAGYTYNDLRSHLKPSTRLLCVMPNTPALVGKGMSVLYKEHTLTDLEFDFAKSFFQSFGEIEILSEVYADAVVSVSGSSPAFVLLFIEAMADGAVYKGLPRKIAYKLAAQSVLGAATLVKETGKHPGSLKDNVCSPGGTTIEAIRSLEKNKFRSTMMEAIIAAADKAQKIK